MNEIYDVIIIGSGPGGLSAAIYSGRYARKTIVLGASAGGTAGKAGEIENWPGTKKIGGLELMNNFREHALQYDVEFKDKLAVEIKKVNNQFEVNLGDEKINGKTIILSLGTKTRHLEIPGEKELAGRGVSYCATCDGMFFRNKDIVIIGGSDSACKAAVYLADICNSVKIIYRGNKLRGEPVYLKKIEGNPKIEIIYNTNPTKINGEKKVESITIKDNEENEKEIKTDGVFVEIGSVPEMEITKKLGLKTDEKGYVIVGRDMVTNVPGIFAIGDMTNAPLRQIVTAAGEGAVAANQAHEYLNQQE